MIEQMITNYEPHILVLANDNFHASNSFIRICRLKGIPSLLIQDGIIGRKTLGSFDFIRWWNFACWRFISKVLDSNLASKLSVSLGCQWVVPDWGMGKSTKIAAMGRYYKQVLVSRGISAESIVVTGYPLLDDIVTSSPHPKNRKLLEELGLQSARPIILLLTQPFVEDHVWSRNTRDEFVDLVRHSVEQINGQLVIKIHPREDSNVYNSIIREKHISSPIVITKDRDLNTLIQSSDVVLTVNSTAGLWVLANEKPLLVVNCFETISENIFEDLATTIDVSTGLTNMIRKVLAETQQIRKSRLSSEHSSTSLRTHLHQLDGKASERIARVIFEMAQRDCLKS
jgi:hypothetical protein